MKTVYFVGSSRGDLREFPEKIKDDVGYALYQIQQGVTPGCVKPLKGFGGGVLEIIEENREGTYRAVYSVRFEKALYVLHCFQKKAKHGVRTPLKEIKLIHQRLGRAEAHYKINFTEHQ